MECTASPSWEPLIVAFISGGCDFTTLYRAAKKPLTRIVARLAPSMPADLREDTIQEVFVRLLENPPKHDPSRCSARTLLFGLLRNAVRHVRATFAPPGQTTRVAAVESEQPTENQPNEVTAQRTTPVIEITSASIEDAPSLRWTADNLESFIAAHELLRRQAPDVAMAAWLVHGLEFSITDTGRLMNQSRFTVARALREVSVRAKSRRNELEQAQPLYFAPLDRQTVPDSKGLVA